jgi:hypothetical protein
MNKRATEKSCKSSEEGKSIDERGKAKEEGK